MKTALITGASGGIGLELAKLFARDGYHLVLVSRSGDHLEQIAKELQSHFDVRVLCIAIDLSSPDAPHLIFDQLQKTSVTIDVLVNNAGHALYGYFYRIDLKPQTDMIELNITSLTKLTYLFLEGMLERKQGRILNVASTAAFQPGPMMAVYYATKSFVLHFSEALRNELKGTGVTVTALCPGPTKTGFQERAQMPRVLLFSRLFLMEASQAARAGYRGLMRNQGLVIPGILNKSLAFLTRLGPRGVNTAMVRLLQKPKKEDG